MTLADAIDNAEFAIGDLRQDLLAGRAWSTRHIHALCAYFRMRGVCEMLRSGVAAPLHRAQLQEASAYLHWLSLRGRDAPTVSWAQPWFAAIGGCHWPAVSAMASATPLVWNRSVEHEDEFLFVAFLMRRYGLGAPAAEQARTLAELRAAAKGVKSARWPVCEALHARDAAAFEAAFEQILAEREAKLERQAAEGVLTEEHLSWARPFYPEGLALIRLAEREGIAVAPMQPGIPEIARVCSPDPWDASAFRS